MEGVIDTGAPSYTGIATQFKMKINRFCCEDFQECVVETWDKPVSTNHSIQRLERKIGGIA